MMGAHVLEQARLHGDGEARGRRARSAPTRSSRRCPFREDDLWNGYPEETNAPYGVAKKALLVGAQAYREQYGLDAIFLLPANLYGPRDNFDLDDLARDPGADPQDGRRADDEIVLWGDGSPTREFLYVDDCADGLVLAAERYDGAEPVNLGTGRRDLDPRARARSSPRLTGFDGRDPLGHVDAERPAAAHARRRRAPRELFGFAARTPLREGLERTIAWYRSHAPGRDVRAWAAANVDGSGSSQSGSPCSRSRSRSRRPSRLRPDARPTRSSARSLTAPPDRRLRAGDVRQVVSRRPFLLEQGAGARARDPPGVRGAGCDRTPPPRPTRVLCGSLVSGRASCRRPHAPARAPVASRFDPATGTLVAVALGLTTLTLPLATVASGTCSRRRCCSAPSRSRSTSGAAAGARAAPRRRLARGLRGDDGVSGGTRRRGDRPLRRRGASTAPPPAALVPAASPASRRCCSTTSGPSGR